MIPIYSLFKNSSLYKTSFVCECLGLEGVLFPLCRGYCGFVGHVVVVVSGLCVDCVCVGLACGDGAEWAWQWGVPRETSTVNDETARDGTQSTCCQERCSQLSGHARAISG